MICEFCGQETDRGSNESGEFACASCMQDYMAMLAPTEIPE